MTESLEASAVFFSPVEDLYIEQTIRGRYAQFCWVEEDDQFLTQLRTAHTESSIYVQEFLTVGRSNTPPAGWEAMFASRRPARAPLSPKQLVIWKWMLVYQKEHEMPPTLGDIGYEFGISKPTIFEHLKCLVDKKWVIHHRAGYTRSYEALRKP